MGWGGAAAAAAAVAGEEEEGRGEADMYVQRGTKRYVTLQSRTQAEQLSMSKNKILATTYKPFC